MQPNLQPVPEKEEARRLVEIEMAATNGMLYTLDPHSVLLDVETLQGHAHPTQGKFGGLGIVIEMDKKNRITVKRPMPDTPAIRVGIKPKDHIVRINNESTVNMTLNEAVDRLRGDVDTNVDVYVERDDHAGPRSSRIMRAFIRPPADRSPAPRVLAASGRSARAGPAGEDRLLPHADFRPTARATWPRRWRCSSSEKVKGIIMDLRGNPGGLYEQAQKVCRRVHQGGTLVSMVGVGGAQRKDETRSTAAMSRRCRWRCWSTRTRPAPRRSWPARSRTSIAASSSERTPSARGRFRCCSTSSRRSLSVTSPRTTSSA